MDGNILSGSSVWAGPLCARASQGPTSSALSWVGPACAQTRAHAHGGTRVVPTSLRPGMAAPAGWCAEAPHVGLRGARLVRPATSCQLQTFSGQGSPAGERGCLSVGSARSLGCGGPRVRSQVRALSRELLHLLDSLQVTGSWFARCAAGSPVSGVQLQEGWLRTSYSALWAGPGGLGRAPTCCSGSGGESTRALTCASDPGWFSPLPKRAADSPTCSLPPLSFACTHSFLCWVEAF